MSETKETIEKTVRAGIRKPLSLKRTVESGHVQQKFSHGRSKSVVVEKKKKRTLPAPETHEPSATVAPPAEPRVMQRTQAPSAEPPRAADLKQPTVLRTLSDEERAARAKALAAAHVRDAEEERVRAERLRVEIFEAAERQRREEEEEEGELRRRREAEEAKKRAPAAREKADLGPKEVALEVPAKVPSAEPAVTKPKSEHEDPAPRPEPHISAETSAPILKPIGMTRPVIVSRPDRPSARPSETARKAEPEAPKRPAKAAATLADLSEEEDARVKKKPGKVLRGPVKGVDEGRVRGRLTITNAFDERQRERSLASLKRKREREKLKALGIPQPREKIVREVVIPEAITIQDLSNRMSERAVDLIKFLMKQGEMHKITDVIDADTAELIVQEFGHTPKRVSEADVEEGFIGEKDAEANLKSRPPVVTIMGHVDHGKTSLLDAIRHASVAAGEVGGITQHIGAYQVVTPSGDRITFIDTPGHEAFTAMRARGAKVTDIVVLVVAADEGVMPQTIEAVDHARAAGVPIVVAVNKIDKPEADPTRVRQQLAEAGIQTSEWGGDYEFVDVSAKTGLNLDKLLETILLVAELQELKADPQVRSTGVAIEAHLDKGRGPVATVLVRRGTLRTGDAIVCGAAHGRVRAMLDENGQPVEEAPPGRPVQVLGWSTVPQAGDEFRVLENEKDARHIAQERGARLRARRLVAAQPSVRLEDLLARAREGEVSELNIVLKADTQGSLEALTDSLEKLSTDEVAVRVVRRGVGAVTESDVMLAQASQAIVVGFNVRPDPKARDVGDREGVDVRLYRVIYQAVDDIKQALSGLLAPTQEEVELGRAEVRATFRVPRMGMVAGCYVTGGTITRGARVRLVRDGAVVYDGRVGSLRRFKDDVREVA